MTILVPQRLIVDYHMPPKHQKLFSIPYSRTNRVLSSSTCLFSSIRSHAHLTLASLFPQLSHCSLTHLYSHDNSHPAQSPPALPPGLLSSPSSLTLTSPISQPVTLKHLPRHVYFSAPEGRRGYDWQGGRPCHVVRSKGEEGAASSNIHSCI